MTNRDALLAAAARRFGPAEFTLADLTVAAWEADRRRWGMRGFEDRYPDTKKVAAEVYDRRPKRFRWLTEQAGESWCRRYRLNADGLAAAEALTKTEGRPCRRTA